METETQNRTFKLPTGSHLVVGSVIDHRRTRSEIVVAITDGIVHVRDLTVFEEFWIDLKQLFEQNSKKAA